MTCAVGNVQIPRPRPNRHVVSNPRSRPTCSSRSDLKSCAGGRPWRRNSGSSNRRPISRLRFCSSILIQCLILVFARDVRTNFSQSLCGIWVGDGQNFDRIAAGQLMLQRNDFSVDLRADTMVADLGVNRIGKIDRGGSFRHFFDHSFGREHIDHVVKQIEFHRIHELPVVRQILVPFDELAQPTEDLAVLVVDPARCSLYFQCAAMPYSATTMHFFRTNLKFDMLALRPNDGRMERLIEIRFWNRDVILETPRHRPPQRMDQAQQRHSSSSSYR